jgi:hypothetical protein
MCRKRLLLRGFLVLAAVLIISPVTSYGHTGNAIGKIAGVTADGFSLRVVGENGHMVLNFLFGPATHIEGEMKVGASAGVEYVSLGNADFATRVSVDPRSLMSLQDAAHALNEF